MKRIPLVLAALIAAATACGRTTPVIDPAVARADSIRKAEAARAAAPVDTTRIELKKEFLYDKYTLADQYAYGKGTRRFQFDKIKAALTDVENALSSGDQQWGVLQNRKNIHGESPLVGRWHRDIYGRVVDSLEIERWQSVPLYDPADSLTPGIYGHDGALVRILGTQGKFTLIETIYPVGRGRFLAPSRYVKALSAGVVFRHIAVADRTMQNIMTLEKQGEFSGLTRTWLIRSMNPATTGLCKPPFAQPTPLGYFVMQEKKPKMLYTNDGAASLAGFAPWANRFSNGAYIHGIPTNQVNGAIIEYSWSLGTTPRSHMCVRNASSHAKFVYDWAPVLESLVIVIE